MNYSLAKEIIATKMSPLTPSTMMGKIVWKYKLMASDNLSIINHQDILLTKIKWEFCDINKWTAWELIQSLANKYCQNQRLVAKKENESHLNINKNKQNYLAINEIWDKGSWTYLYTLPMYTQFDIKNISGFIQWTSNFDEELTLTDYMWYIKRLSDHPGNYNLDIWGLRFATNNIWSHTQDKKYSDRIINKSLKKLKHIASFLVK